MSHLRNRFRSTSQSFQIQKKNSQGPAKMNNYIRFTPDNTMSSSLMNVPRHKNRPNTSEEKSYMSNVHHFRDIFNPNDSSQVPFMSSLRRHRRDSSAPKNTVSQGFDVAEKMTCNQEIRKRISDFKCGQRRLSTVFFKWHNKSGRNNLWSTQYGCSLRQYNETPEDDQYDSFIRPIKYQDVEPRTYDKKEMVCTRHHRSFSVK